MGLEKQIVCCDLKIDQLRQYRQCQSAMIIETSCESQAGPVLELPSWTRTWVVVLRDGRYVAVPVGYKAITVQAVMFVPLYATPDPDKA